MVSGVIKLKKFEFSKLILCLVMTTYFVGLLFGIYIILRIAVSDVSYIPTALCGLFSYIGAPVAVAIGFYAYKAKSENVAKITTLNSAFTSEEYVKEECEDEDRY